MESANQYLANVKPGTQIGVVKGKVPFKIFGRFFPLHLIVTIQCTDDIVNIKKTLHAISKCWFMYAARKINAALGGSENLVSFDKTSNSLKGPGWQLGFLFRSENYETHVTLGRMNTNVNDLDNTVVNMCTNGHTIEPDFVRAHYDVESAIEKMDIFARDIDIQSKYLSAIMSKLQKIDPTIDREKMHAYEFIRLKPRLVNYFTGEDVPVFMRGFSSDFLNFAKQNNFEVVKRPTTAAAATTTTTAPPSSDTAAAASADPSDRAAAPADDVNAAAIPVDTATTTANFPSDTTATTSVAATALGAATGEPARRQ